MILKSSQLKREYMKSLYENPKIVSLIDAKDIEYPDELLSTHIFPRLKVDFTVQDVGTYIGLEIDYPRNGVNELYINYILTVMIITHNDRAMVGNADCRNDLLADEVKAMLDWNTDLGFRLKLKSDNSHILNTNYAFRELSFESISYNNLDNKLGAR